jgi:hypothetical protein
VRSGFTETKQVDASTTLTQLFFCSPPPASKPVLLLQVGQCSPPVSVQAFLFPAVLLPASGSTVEKQCLR